MKLSRVKKNLEERIKKYDEFIKTNPKHEKAVTKPGSLRRR